MPSKPSNPNSSAGSSAFDPSLKMSGELLEAQKMLKFPTLEELAGNPTAFPSLESLVARTQLVETPARREGLFFSYLNGRVDQLLQEALSDPNFPPEDLAALEAIYRGGDPGDAQELLNRLTYELLTKDAPKATKKPAPRPAKAPEGDDDEDDAPHEVAHHDGDGLPAYWWLRAAAPRTD